MSLSVYVAAPFADASSVRDVHARLNLAGLTWTSTWAESADGPEQIMNADLMRAAAKVNDSDVARSDVVLVIARDGAGGEMFAEVRFALVLGKPVVWVGRRILSAYRPGVHIAADIDDALRHIATCALLVDNMAGSLEIYGAEP